MNLLPQVKELSVKDGVVGVRAIKPFYGELDDRIIRQLDKLPTHNEGLELSFNIQKSDSEEYAISVQPNSVVIDAQGIKGAFYAVQTLKQLLKWETLPCLTIRDYPDFSYRGVYHDVTRGKIPTLQMLKELVDTLASFKINSLQLYVEHTYEFEECKSINQVKGFLTKQELQELDEYCKNNFIEFIPSIATFGHMYEILQIPQFQNLRVLKDYVVGPNEWRERMEHHTVDPTQPESIELVKSLIDQYKENFSSEYFNICGDETFDLRNFKPENSDLDGESSLYVSFVKKIIKHLKSSNKKVMMWADILLRHPETIKDIPSDTTFLNWDYSPTPWEDGVKTFKDLGLTQIVCPGTWSWNRLIENFEDGESNIKTMAEYGYKYGAKGLLNTNWGDWGNPCSIELALYGLTLGAEKSWSATTNVDADYYAKVNEIVYGSDSAINYIKRVSRLQTLVPWTSFCEAYSTLLHKVDKQMHLVTLEELEQVQREFVSLKTEIEKDSRLREDVKRELLIALEGICLIAELSAKLRGVSLKRMVNTSEWLARYQTAWLAKNKPSELSRIVEMFEFIERY